MFADFRDFISKKTPAALKRELGVESLNTIYGWSHRNHIPRDVWPDLVEKFPELGNTDLKRMEAVAKPLA